MLIQATWHPSVSLTPLRTFLRDGLILLLSLILGATNAIPDRAPISYSIVSPYRIEQGEQLAYYLWFAGNELHTAQAKFYEAIAKNFDPWVNHLQDESGMTEAVGLSEWRDTLPLPTLYDIQSNRQPLHGFRTVRGYLFAFIAAAPGKAIARIPHGGAVLLPVVSCPFGTTGNANNFCSGSPSGSFQVANFFTGYTGTSYPSRPAFNVPAVDYANGVPSVASAGVCTVSSLADPNQSPAATDDPGCGLVPHSCTYSVSSPSGQLSIPKLTCVASSNQIVMRGLDLCAIGGHNATTLTVDTTGTGGILLEYFRQCGDAATYSQNGFLNTSNGAGTENVTFKAFTQLGHWQDSFSTQGSGTCSASGTQTMTCTGDSGIQVGQYLFEIGNTNVIAINGGGSYTLGQNRTFSSQLVHTQFQMAGGMNLSTSGNTSVTYSAGTQINGRIGTFNKRDPGQALSTVGTDTQNGNYFENGIYSNCYSGSCISHYEAIEYVIQDGNTSLTWGNQDFSGNVNYQPAALAPGSVTGAYFLNTGNIGGTIAGSFLVSYPSVNINNPVVVSLGGGGAGTGGGALIDMGGEVITTLAATNAWIDRNATNGAPTFSNCTSNPSDAGSPNSHGSAVSFFIGQGISATETDVTTFQGGVPIDSSGGSTVGETNMTITGVISGTPGGVAHYSGTGGKVVSSQNMRSALNMITNAPSFSGTDLSTGSAIAASSFMTRTLGSAPCVYPGQQ